MGKLWKCFYFFWGLPENITSEQFAEELTNAYNVVVKNQPEILPNGCAKVVLKSLRGMQVFILKFYRFCNRTNSLEIIYVNKVKLKWLILEYCGNFESE